MYWFEYVLLGLSTPAAVTLPQTTFRELGAAAVMAALIDTLGLPLMVKPARGGSSLGAAVVRTAESLPAAMVGCFSYGDTALVEQFVSGPRSPSRWSRPTAGRSRCPPSRSCPTAASTTTPPATPRAPPSSSRRPGSWRRSPPLARGGRDGHRALRLRDLSRTDLVVDADGRPWFLEVNVAPGDDRDLAVPAGRWPPAGQDLGALWRALVDRAAARG